MSEKIEMWEKVVNFLQENGFKHDKENINRYSMIVFRHPDNKGLLVKAYEGRVHIGSCFSIMKSSFQSILRYNKNKPCIINAFYDDFIKEYPIAKDIIDIVMEKDKELIKSL